MPLVRRKIQTETITAHTKRLRDHVCYVPRARMLPSDEVVEPSTRQLADLAITHPKEYAELAAERGIEIEVELDPAIEREAQKVVALSAKKASSAIQGITNPDLLARIEVLEEERTDITPRTTVLGAIEGRLEALAAEEEEDEAEDDDEDGDEDDDEDDEG